MSPPYQGTHRIAYDQTSPPTMYGGAPLISPQGSPILMPQDQVLPLCSDPSSIQGFSCSGVSELAPRTARVRVPAGPLSQPLDLGKSFNLSDLICKMGVVGRSQ